MIWFTFGSRKNGMVGLRRESEVQVLASLSPTMPMLVFQSEINAIVLNARENLAKKLSGKIIYILPDGQAVTARALYNLQLKWLLES